MAAEGSSGGKLPGRSANMRTCAVVCLIVHLADDWMEVADHTGVALRPNAAAGEGSGCRYPYLSDSELDETTIQAHVPWSLPLHLARLGVERRTAHRCPLSSRIRISSWV